MESIETKTTFIFANPLKTDRRYEIKKHCSLCGYEMLCLSIDIEQKVCNKFDPIPGNCQTVHSNHGCKYERLGCDGCHVANGWIEGEVA